MITLHGIKNCDSVRKARRWLEQRDIDYAFRDFRESAPDIAELESWLELCEWEGLLNRRSTTWKGLSDDQRAGVIDRTSAARLMAAQPTLIKRPVLIDGNTITLGFKAQNYSALFEQST